MLTEFTFDQIIAVGGHSGGGGSTPYPMTATAVINDGSIDVGDEVVLSNVSNLIFNITGIDSGDHVYYHGATIVDGYRAYIFSADPHIVVGSPLIFAFDGVPDRVSTFLPGAIARGDVTYVIEDTPACFLAGTLIDTPDGPVPVETLKEGDLVLTVDGRATPVAWLGEQFMPTPFVAPEVGNPIRIAADAIADSVPRRDLFVSPDHAVCVDDILFNASALVNGSTIRQVERMPGRGFTYYHVETAAHELILAEGCPAETYTDDLGRNHFNNYAGYLERFGKERVIEEMPLIRVSTKRLVPHAVQERLALRATKMDVCEGKDDAFAA
ncbi:MAG: Hint domain-containing protein [Pseudomonadota bacterium]